MTNPERAIDALLDGKVEVEGETIYPLSIGRIALLDKIGAPMMTGENDSISTVVQAWAMTRPMEELAKCLFKEEQIRTEALLWADTLDTAKFRKITEAILSAFARLNAVSEGTGEDDKKKAAPTDG